MKVALVKMGDLNKKMICLDRMKAEGGVKDRWMHGDSNSRWWWCW